MAPSSPILQWDKFIENNFELCSIPDDIPCIPSAPKLLLLDIFILRIFLLDSKILFKDSELAFTISKFSRFIFLSWFKLLQELKNVVLFSSVDIFDMVSFNIDGWFNKNSPNSITALSE